MSRPPPLTVVRRSADADAEMAAEVRASLLGTPPSIPCKYLYDARGSRLFERITRLPEYYPTRTELAILGRVAGEVAAATRPREVVELGSGSGRKTRLLLDALGRVGPPVRCTLFDISPSALLASLSDLRGTHPEVRFRGLQGDFVLDLAALGPGEDRLLVLFAGTIGNLHPDIELPAFLARTRAVLGPGGAFLVGVDLVKDASALEAAYDDARGVTAAFDLNVLKVVNERLGADFDPDAWRHRAFYDRRQAWVEMRLRASRAQRVHLPAAELELTFARGDEIRTEISAKYTRASFERRLAAAALALDGWWTDDPARFALALARPASAAGESPAANARRESMRIRRTAAHVRAAGWGAEAERHPSRTPPKVAGDASRGSR